MRAIPRSLLVVTLAVLCAASTARAQDDLGPFTPDEWDALNVLQGAVRGPVIDSATLATATRALRLIRDRYPAVRGIPTGPDETVIDVYLTPAQAMKVARANGRVLGRGTGAFDASTLASPVLDSLNALYHVRRLRVEYNTVYDDAVEFAIRVSFSLPVNASVVAKQYDRAPGVHSAGQVGWFTGSGGRSRTEIVMEHPLWHFVFIRDSAIHDGAVYYVTYGERDSTTAMEPNPPRRDDP